jgi:hypothetical protein
VLVRLYRDFVLKGELVRVGLCSEKLSVRQHRLRRVRVSVPTNSRPMCGPSHAPASLTSSCPSHRPQELPSIARDDSLFLLGLQLSILHRQTGFVMVEEKSRGFGDLIFFRCGACRLSFRDVTYPRKEDVIHHI